MAVIESIMLLYSREVITSDRVVAAVQRFGHSRVSQIPSTHEQGALLWIQHACDALKGRIEQESGGVVENGGSVSFSVYPTNSEIEVQYLAFLVVLDTWY